MMYPRLDADQGPKLVLEPEQLRDAVAAVLKMSSAHCAAQSLYTAARLGDGPGPRAPGVDLIALALSPRLLLFRSRWGPTHVEERERVSVLGRGVRSRLARCWHMAARAPYG